MGHKNLVRKLQKLLRPVLKSPARALSNGVLNLVPVACKPCWVNRNFLNNPVLQFFKRQYNSSLLSTAVPTRLLLDLVLVGIF